MKKVFLTMVSALAVLATTAAPGIDKNSGRQALGSRADRVTQAEMMMFSECIDGFGLDAEEYEMMMSQDFDMMDGVSMTFTMPTCAGGDVPSLNGAGAGGWSEQPIIRKVIHGIVRGDETNGNLPVRGNVRPDNTPSLNGGGAGGWSEPPIIRPRLHRVGSGNGGFDQMGTTRPDNTPSLNGGQPTGWGDQPIIRKAIHVIVKGDETNGNLPVRGNVRPGGGNVDQ